MYIENELSMLNPNHTDRNMSKTKIGYLNWFFRYSKKRVGVPGDPRAKNRNFSYLKKIQKIFRMILTIDFRWLYDTEQKSQKNQCSKINGFPDICDRICFFPYP